METEPLFSDEERQKLILAYIDGAGARGATQAEMGEFIRWCETLVLGGTLVEMVIAGDLLPFKADGDKGEDDLNRYYFTAKGTCN